MPFRPPKKNARGIGQQVDLVTRPHVRKVFLLVLAMGQILSGYKYIAF